VKKSAVPEGSRRTAAQSPAHPVHLGARRHQCGDPSAPDAAGIPSAHRQPDVEAYPNLFIDLSWSMLTPYLLDEQGKPRAQWLALVEKYPERFMLGSDVVGRFNKLGEEMRSFTPFLDALPEDVARKVARDNFLAILPRTAAKSGNRAESLMPRVQVSRPLISPFWSYANLRGADTF
jgi:hypothetical protein